MDDELLANLAHPKISKPGTQLSAISLATYSARLRLLMVATGKCLYKSLTEAKATYTKLQSAYPELSTRKNIVTAVNGLLSRTPTFPDGARGAWKRYMNNLAQLDAAKRDDNRATPAMRKKLIDVEETRKIARALSKRILSLKDSMEHVLLTMMVEMPPKRSDFGELQVKATESSSHSGNYVVVPAKVAGVVLVLNEYKTAKAYGELREELPSTVAAALRKSLADYPREYVFVGRKGKKLTAAAYGEFVKRTFLKHTGKPAGVSALRHAYISQVCNPGKLTQTELKRVAASMGHSVNEQGRYQVVGGAR